MSSKGEAKPTDGCDTQNGPTIPLQLTEGHVERPAIYQYDEKFWRKTEKLNPGILEKVKRILAFYFDNDEERKVLGLHQHAQLRKGVDYDFISGRSVIIKLGVPVAVGDYEMKELVLKGASFKKSEEGQEYYSLERPTEENIRQLKKEEIQPPEFDEKGFFKFVEVRFARKGAIFYSQATNEYEIGRTCFKDDKCPVRILPVMNVRYLLDKAPNGSELGVVVIANPSETVHFNNKDVKNRIGHMISIMIHRLRISFSEPNAEPIKEETYQKISEYAGVYGRALRLFHDAGYTHANPHSGNLIVDMDNNEVHVVDLSDARQKSKMTKEQAFGYQLRDICYATQDFMRAIFREESSSKFIAPIIMHMLRSFLVNYFKEDNEMFRRMADHEIMGHVQAIEVLMCEKICTAQNTPVQFSSGEISLNPLARLVSKTVFESDNQMGTGNQNSQSSLRVDG